MGKLKQAFSQQIFVVKRNIGVTELILILLNTEHTINRLLIKMLNNILD